MKFVYSEDPQKNEVVKKDLDLLVNYVTSHIKNITSIMLIGGFARGEGAVIYYNNQLLPVNDYDLYLISEKEISQGRMEQIIDECNHLFQQTRKPARKSEANLKIAFDFQKDFHVDGHYLNIQDLPRLPAIIRYWEMRRNGLLLYGKDARHLMRNFSQDEIPLSEGFRFLNNCLTTLIRIYKSGYKEPVWYFGNRIWAYFIVSLLLLKRQLEPTYLLRAKKFTEIYEKEFSELYQEFPDLAKQVWTSTMIKLDPPSKVDLSDKELLRFWKRTRKVGLKVLDFYLKNWIGSGDLQKNLQKASVFYFRPYIKDNLSYGKKLFPIYNLSGQFFLNLKYIWRIWRKEKRLFAPKNPFIAIDIKLWQLLPEVLDNLENPNSKQAKIIFNKIPYFSSLTRTQVKNIDDFEFQRTWGRRHLNSRKLDLQEKYLLAFRHAERTRDVQKEINIVKKILNKQTFSELGYFTPNRNIYFAKRLRLIQKSIKGQKILDVGCGTGRILLTLKKPGRELFGVDINEDYLRQINDPLVKNCKMNAENLEFPDEKFDTVLASDIIEHLDHPLKALSEWTRVLKKGGCLIIIQPNKNLGVLKKLIGPNPFHKREFGYFELKKILEQEYHYKIIKSHKLFLMSVEIPFFRIISWLYEALMPSFMTLEVFFVCKKMK